jgi:hypothetical protein
MLAFGVLWLLHQGPLENYDGMRTDTRSVSALSATRAIAGWYHFPSTVSPPLGPNQGSAKEKEFPCSFALSSPTNIPEGKGITACSQGVLRTLTCLFTP